MSGTILVPIDFEAPSQQALKTALGYAPKLGLSVVLVHVYTVPVFVYPGFSPIVTPGFPADIEQAAQQALTKLAEECGHLKTMLRTGDPAMEILAAVDELKPELVVMGTHGRKGFAHFILGSVAERVVRQCPVPVLTIRTSGI